MNRVLVKTHHFKMLNDFAVVCSDDKRNFNSLQFVKHDDKMISKNTDCTFQKKSRNVRVWNRATFSGCGCISSINTTILVYYKICFNEFHLICPSFVATKLNKKQKLNKIHFSYNISRSEKRGKSANN